MPLNLLCLFHSELIYEEVGILKIRHDLFHMKLPAGYVGSSFLGEEGLETELSIQSILQRIS